MLFNLKVDIKLKKQEVVFDTVICSFDLVFDNAAFKDWQVNKKFKNVICRRTVVETPVLDVFWQVLLGVGTLDREKNQRRYISYPPPLLYLCVHLRKILTFKDKKIPSLTVTFMSLFLVYQSFPVIKFSFLIM